MPVKFRNEDIHYFCIAIKCCQGTKAEVMGSTLACTEEVKLNTNFLSGYFKGRDHVGG
jgi:hypothetical protein